ncbi:unnamed protein product, partial [marine sediment metagenome]
AMSMVCAMLGVSRIQKFLGVGKSLALLPIVIGIAVFTFKMYPIITVLFWLMVLSKAINYALNKPT